MFVLMALWLSGVYLARVVLGVNEHLPSMVLGGCLSFCLSVVPVNMWFTFGGSASGAMWATTVLFLGVALFSRKRLKPGILSWKIASWEWSLVIPLAFFVWLWTNGFQYLSVDEDYWIHTPLVVNFSLGVFPPQNPFFSEVTLGGHYGRDLMMGCVMAVTEWDVLKTQFHSTSVYQTLLFLMTWLTIRREADFLPSYLAGLFLLFGINVGWKSGLIASFHANYPPSYLCFVLAVFLLAELFRRPTYSKALFCGLTFAAQALFFETILVALVLGSIPAVWVSRKSKLGPLALAYLLGLLLCLTQGGAISQLLSRPESVVLGELTQRQTVVLSFPRRPFLTVPMVGPFPTEAARCEPNKTFYQWLMSPPRGEWGDVSIFSKSFLGLHWLALWLCPVTLWYLRRESRTATKLLACAGIVSFLIPGMFHFGPVYDTEWYRWQYAAGFGLALSLGVVVGRWFEDGPHWKRVLATFIVTFNILGGIDYSRLAWAYSEQIPLGSWLGYGYDTQRYLVFHNATLGVYREDLEILERLNLNSSKAKTVFVNFDPEKTWDLLFESTLIGFTGLQPVGHDFPRPDDYIGRPPGRMKALHSRALGELTPEALYGLGTDYVCLRLKREEVTREQIDALRNSSLFAVEAHRSSASDGRIRILLRAIRD